MMLAPVFSAASVHAGSSQMTLKNTDASTTKMTLRAVPPLEMRAIAAPSSTDGSCVTVQVEGIRATDESSAALASP
jgi:hypothetical protein